MRCQRLASAGVGKYGMHGTKNPIDRERSTKPRTMPGSQKAQRLSLGISITYYIAKEAFHTAGT
jgi:hypothetical protein